MVHSSKGFRRHVHAPYPRQGSNPREASSGRYILISSNLLKQLNEALTMTDPRTSYFGGIITHWQVSKC